MIEVIIGNEPIEVSIGDAINYYDGNVQSVNGKEGDVVLDANDVGADVAGSADSALIEAKGYTDLGLATKADVEALSHHIDDKSNPHEVTKNQIGLGNVPNLAPADLPISTDTQSALDLKENQSNKKGNLFANSDIFFPTQKAVNDALNNLSEEVDDKLDEKADEIATQNALDSKANADETVNLTGNQTINGKKTFANSPTVPNPAVDADATNKLYVDDRIDTLGNEVVDGLSQKVSRQTPTERSLYGVATGGVDEVIRVSPTANNSVPIRNASGQFDVGTPSSPTQVANKSYVDTAGALKENLTNKSTSIILGTSDTLYPTQNAVKSYVDTVVRSETKGWVVVPGNPLFGTSDFKVMKYHAKNLGDNVPRSLPEGKPWVNISQINAKSVSQVLGEKYHLITEAEWLTLAHNIASVASNWTGGAVGSGQLYRGHTDNSPAESLPASSSDADGWFMTGQTSGEQRRTMTLTNGEVIWDLAGNVYDWIDQTTTGAGAQPGAPSGGDYAWRQWNAANNLDGDFPQSNPAYGTPAAANWTSSQGIGQVYASNVQAGLRAFRRGGSWNYGADAGVFALGLNYAPSDAYAYVGFRVAQDI